MELESDAWEYLLIDFDASFSPDTVEVELMGVWYPTTIVGSAVQFLVAGEDAEGAPVEAIVLPAGHHLPRLRFDTGLDMPIRKARSYIVVSRARLADES